MDNGFYVVTKIEGTNIILTQWDNGEVKEYVIPPDSLAQEIESVNLEDFLVKVA